MKQQLLNVLTLCFGFAQPRVPSTATQQKQEAYRPTLHTIPEDDTAITYTASRRVRMPKKTPDSHSWLLNADELSPHKKINQIVPLSAENQQEWHDLPFTSHDAPACNIL